MKDNHKADISHTAEFDRMYQEMVKQAEDKYKVKSEHPKTEEEIGLVDKFSSRWVNEFNLPEGYIFKDENGNVINATKIVLEKKEKEYPKTYEECCKVLGLNDLINMHLSFMNEDTKIIASTNYHTKTLILLNCLTKLRICRDAYWTLYGKEIGFWKLWEPDWKSGSSIKFCITIYDNEILNDSTTHCNTVLAFPTAKMRDAFYENFKELIEQCKELL